jgi:hypothetical protein
MRTNTVVDTGTTVRPPAGNTAPTTPAAPTPRAVPTSRDSNQVTTKTSAGTAVASITLSAPPVDLRSILPGFTSGCKLDVDATGAKALFVSGDGRISTLSANMLKMNLHVTAPGVDERLSVDLRAEGGGYRLRSPENWPVSIEKHGQWYRLTNLDNPKQNIEIRSTGGGEAEIRTHGMKGVDGTTLTIEVDD